MNRQLRAGILASIFLAVAFLTGCNSSNYNTPTETIAATSGTPQSAALNTAFSAPLVATVTMGGLPVSGAFVVFHRSGDGSERHIRDEFVVHRNGYD
jgi:hypothetical protein